MNGLNRIVRRVLAAVVVLATATGAMAGDAKLSHFLCPSELRTALDAIKTLRVPLGCDLVDCCPLCRQEGEISADVRLEGSLARGTRLEVTGLSGAAVKKLRVKGAKISGRFIDVPPGKSVTVSGIPSNSRGWLVPVAKFVDPGAGLLPDPSVAAFKLTIFKRVGQQRVGLFELAYGNKTTCGPAPTPTEGDRIAVQNVASGPIISVIDYQTDLNACIPDEARATNASPVFLGANAVPMVATCPDVNPSVALLGEERAVSYRRVNQEWTGANSDVLSVTLGPKVDVPLALWVVDGAVTEEAATDIGLVADLIYEEWDDAGVKRKNHGGVHFIPAVKTVTLAGLGLSAAPNCEPGTIAKIKNSGFYSSFGLNVYIYKSTNVSGYCAQNGRDIINLNPVDSLVNALEHEIGHAFGLHHTDGCAGIPHPNVMATGSYSPGPAFTAAQSVRMHIDKNSVLNQLLNAWGVVMRTGDIEDCTARNRDGPGPGPATCEDFPTAQCPAITLDP